MSVPSVVTADARQLPLAAGQEPRTPTQIPVACFAPPLTDEALAACRALAEALPPELAEHRDGMRACLACVEAWWALPESTRTDGPVFQHGVPDGADERGAPRFRQVRYQLAPLEEAHVRALWDVTPWMRELNLMGELFEGLTGPVRDAAFHLLWHAKEITLEREPLTRDKIQNA